MTIFGFDLGPLTPSAKVATVGQAVTALFGDKVAEVTGTPAHWTTLVPAVLFFLTPIVAATYNAWLKAFLAGKPRRERLKAAADAGEAAILAEIRERIGNKVIESKIPEPPSSPPPPPLKRPEG